MEKSWFHLEWVSLEEKNESVKNWKFWVSTRKLFVRVIRPLETHWWQNFYSRWRSFWVIANRKSEKFGRKGIMCPFAIFSVNFFSLNFLHQWIYEDHISRRFSFYHIWLCKSGQKMAAKLKFCRKSAISPDVHMPFFL